MAIGKTPTSDFAKKMKASKPKQGTKKWYFDFYEKFWEELHDYSRYPAKVDWNYIADKFNIGVGNAKLVAKHLHRIKGYFPWEEIEIQFMKKNNTSKELNISSIKVGDLIEHRLYRKYTRKNLLGVVCSTNQKTHIFWSSFQEKDLKKVFKKFIFSSTSRRADKEKALEYEALRSLAKETFWSPFWLKTMARFGFVSIWFQENHDE